ncbi:MAG: molybdate transport system substrate-binding protein [Planctomycetota bacterium]|jgi:molybdate transport system substrate-binding protein
MSFPRVLIILCFLTTACTDQGSLTVTIRVASASNFVPVLDELGREFTEATGVVVSVSSASTGMLYAQIENGAPFDVFLAADKKRPEALIENGHADSDSAFIYAQGRLAMICAKSKTLPQDLPSMLQLAPFDLTMANSKLAPYGRAALEALDEDVESLTAKGVKVIRGENASQAWHFLASGAADFAVLPLSMAATGDFPYREIPGEKFETIDQMAVLIKGTKAESEARQFLKFLQSKKARTRIKNSGYNVVGG